MRGALKIPAVLERARLTLVSIYGQISRAFIGPHKAPFCTRGEARAAQTAQSGVEHFLLDVFPIHVCTDVFQRRVSACRRISGVCFVVGYIGMGIASRDRYVHLFRGGVINMVVPNFQHRGGITTPHAGRAQDADLLWIKTRFQCRFQRLCPSQFTRQRIANPDGQRRWRCFILFHHVEMRIKCRDFVNFGHRHAHLFGQRA